MRYALSCLVGDNLLEFIEGHLLGDMYIWPRKTGAQIGLGDKNKQYVKYIKEYFETEKINCSKVYQGQRCFKTHTRTYKEFLDIYNKWYPDGKKIIPSDLILTPLKLKFWYIGDGSLRYDKRCTKQNPYIRLSTCLFTENECKFLINQLDNFGIKSYLHYNGQYPVIDVSAKSGQKFLNITDSSPVSCYDYKWRTP